MYDLARADPTVAVTVLSTMRRGRRDTVGADNRVNRQDVRSLTMTTVRRRLMPALAVALGIGSLLFAGSGPATAHARTPTGASAHARAATGATAHARAPYPAV